MLRSKKALISVSDKAGIADFAGELIAMEWDITASPGTAKVLREAGHTVADIQEITGIPAILGHRVFSEHIKIAGALVAEPSESHDSDRVKYDISWFDLLCVDLYPLSDAIARGKTERDVIDSTDIGGITLIRNAVKGRRIVIADPIDRPFVIEQLRKNGDVTEEVRRELCAKAELLCAKYCLESAKYIGRKEIDGFIGTRSIDLCYGENPYQSDAGFFDCDSDDELSIVEFKQLTGDKPSYVNITSLDAIVKILLRLSAAFSTHYQGKVPYIAIGAKHGSPVGASIDWDAQENALHKMLWGDPKVIWGGEVITNFAVSAEVAGILLSDVRRRRIGGTDAWMLDLIAAPDFDHKGIEILRSRGKRRVFCNPLLSRLKPSGGFVYRNVLGGFVKQPVPDYVLKEDDMDWVGEPLFDVEFDTLLLSWGIAWSMHMNGIALARDRQLLGCDGQPSSVGAVKTAINKAREGGHSIAKAVFAANAFLPFSDSAELLADSECIGGLLPKGGEKEGSIRDLFAGRGMRVAFTPQTYRGFSRH
jgi:phosphoribosylaminoimidazolecarboxamide formyltransferase/IMP cyclohydrolase